MPTPVKLLRAVALGSAGLLTFYVAAQWSRAGRDDADEIVLPAAPTRAAITASPRPRAASDAASAAAPAAEIPASASRPVPSGDGQAFARLSWLPPPPPPPPPPPSPPPPPPVVPTAPPLPFAFVGMVENGTGKPQAFLSRGETLLVVSAGDLVDNGTYRIDTVNGNQVVITYMPLTMKQTIDVSGGAK